MEESHPSSIVQIHTVCLDKATAPWLIPSHSHFQDFVEAVARGCAENVVQTNFLRFVNKFFRLHIMLI